MENIVVVEMWEDMKEFIKEKDRGHVVKNLLVLFEEHGLLGEADFEGLIGENPYFEEAVKSIYKEMGEEYEEEDDPWDDEE